MGNFGAAVHSLLDTYTKCLSLLRGFRASDADHGAASVSQSKLSKSLRSDRSSIRRAYSSRASQNGSLFEKGDGESRLPVLARLHMSLAWV